MADSFRTTPETASAQGAALQLPLRSRGEAFKGSGVWQATQIQHAFPGARTAVLNCKMWDRHRYASMSHRLNELARRMDPVVNRARKARCVIVHSPSETIDFCSRDTPQCLRMQSVPKVTPPKPLKIKTPPLPLTASTGGCKTPESFYKARTRENRALHIEPDDRISNDGLTIFSFSDSAGSVMSGSCASWSAVSGSKI